MVFSSVSFCFFFLPIFLVCYFLSPGNRSKNITALWFSLIFYGWGEPWFVLVLLLSIAFNTRMALVIDACEGRSRSRCLALTVSMNLLMLGLFKYSDFALANIDAM